MTVVQAIVSVILAFLACNFFIQKFRDRHREEKQKSAEFLPKSQDLAAESEPANSEVKSQRKVKRKYRDGIATISEIFGKGGDGMYPLQGIEDAYGDLMVDNLLDISSSSFLKVTLDINENLVNTIRFVMHGKKDILSASEYVKRKIISGRRKSGKVDAGETLTGQLQRKLQATSIPRFRTLQAASNRATKPAAKATLRVVTKSLPSAAPPTTPITAKRTTAQTVTESAQITSAQGAAKPGSGAAPPITVTITVNRAPLVSGTAPSTANETARTNSVPSASKPTTSTQVRTPSQTRTPKPEAAVENAPAVGASVFANSVNGPGRDRSRLKSPRSSPIQSDPRARPDRIEPYLRPEPSTKSPVTEPPTLEPPGSIPIQSDPRAIPDRTERYLRPEPSHKSPVTEPSRLEQSGLLASLVLDPAAERSTSPEQRNYPHLRDLILRSVQLRPKDQSVEAWVKQAKLYYDDARQHKNSGILDEAYVKYMSASNIIMGVIPRCIGFVAFCNSDKDSRRSFQNMVENIEERIAEFSGISGEITKDNKACQVRPNSGVTYATLYSQSLCDLRWYYFCAWTTWEASIRFQSNLLEDWLAMAGG